MKSEEAKGAKTPALLSDDVHPPTPPPRRRRHPFKNQPRPVDLASLRDVRLELAYVYGQMDTGAIAEKEAKARCYVLHTIYQVLASGLEKRVEAMEKAMRARGYQLPDLETIPA